MGREFEPNADFDLTLRPRWPGPVSGVVKRRIDELALQFVLAGGGSDSIRLPGDLPDDFLASMDRHLMVVPRVTVRPTVRSEQVFTPFGWNAAAAECNLAYDRPTLHPPLDAVRRANGRPFAAAVERELVGGRYHVGDFDSEASLAGALEDASGARFGWMAKSHHGNAGLGNRRLRQRRLTATDRRWLQSTLNEDDGVVVEPWCRRIADLCVTFDVGPGGRPTDLAAHEVINTSDGAFLGALFEARSEVVERWRSELWRAGEVVAARLTSEGYFGPVCFDAFVWDDDGRHRLRPLADLNARYHMSLAARRLWRVWGGGSVVYWRMFSRRKLRIPERHDLMERQLGSDDFDAGAMRGVLVVTPLRVGWDGRPRHPWRLGVLFVGQSRAEVFAYERRFRSRFER